MTWPSIREFLRIPDNLTGKGVNIAIIDSSFANHPDIASDENRSTYIVKTAEHLAQPLLMHSNGRPWTKGLHGLSCAAAAAGSGELSGGYYTGAAPAANFYLLETGPRRYIVFWPDYFRCSCMYLGSSALVIRISNEIDPNGK